MNNYLLIALLWVAVCLLLGIYISGKWMSGKTQFKIGLGAMIVTFLMGITFLLFAVIHL